MTDIQKTLMNNIDFTQVLVAGVETVAVNRMKNYKDVAILTGAVAVSNLVPASYGMGMSEKYILEPLVAGALYTGIKYMTTKKGGYTTNQAGKKFIKGFLIGATSAGIAGQINAMY